MRYGWISLIVITLTFSDPRWGPAQTASPEASGLRFNRFGAKQPETLADKPSGPTERIETIVTPDNIDYVIKTYKMTRGNASDIFAIIQGSVALEGGVVFRVAPDIDFEFAGGDRLIDIHREGESYLVVTAPVWMIDDLDQTIEMLDAPGLTSEADGTGSLFLKMKHHKPSEVAELLIATAASGFEVIIPDDPNNVLYIENAPSDFAALLDALTYYDVPQETAMLGVKIIELEESDAANLGVYWDAWKEALPAVVDAELFDSRLSVGGQVDRLREGTAVLSGVSP